MTMRKRTTNRYRSDLETPLASVARNYDPTAAWAQCAALLLDAGADPNFHNNEEDSGLNSPLYHALVKWRYNPSSDGNTEHLMERMIRGSHVALTGSTLNGAEQSVWMYAFHLLSPLPLKILKALLDMGCDINETAVNLPRIPDGWTCLFLQVLRAPCPKTSRTFEVTRFLIRQRANIYAKDGYGLTIFDHVGAAMASESSSYRRDLWYCALQREGIDIGAMIEEHPRIAKYDEDYTPEHYRALCHLDHWTDENLSQQVHNLLEAYPWSEEEISEISRIRDENEAEAARMAEAQRELFDIIGEDPSKEVGESGSSSLLVYH